MELYFSSSSFFVCLEIERDRVLPLFFIWGVVVVVVQQAHVPAAGWAAGLSWMMVSGVELGGASAADVAATSGRTD